MNLGAFADRIRMDRRIWGLFGAALIAALIASEVGFRIAGRAQARVADLAVEGLLQREDLFTNPYLLDQAVSDLERLGMIRCTFLNLPSRPEVAQFLNHRQDPRCSGISASWLMPVADVAKSVQAGNGDKWEAAYDVPLGPAYALGVWGARILLVTLFVGGAWWLSSSLAHERRLHEIKSEHARELFQIASTVSHNIRSPVHALRSVVTDQALSGFPPKDQSVIRGALDRIDEVAQSLLKMRREMAEPALSDGPPVLEQKALNSEWLIPAIEQIVSEKRIEYRGRPGIAIEADMPADSSIFAKVDLPEFKSILSNLINNAVQAIDASKGCVDVKVTRAAGGGVVIAVVDSGKGIAPEHLEKVGREGYSVGKGASGNGLGLFHAKKCVQDWGGDLTIQSAVGKGTEVTITLPMGPVPQWMASELTLRSGTQVVVVDDDPCIHDLWRRRFADTPELRPFEMISFHSANEFRRLYEVNGKTSKETTYLFDHNLGPSEETGLQLIRGLDLACSSILITSQADDRKIQAECLSLGIKMLPKDLIYAVKVTVEAAAKRRLDAILIDDDALTQLSWSGSAEKYGKNVQIFSDSATFFAQVTKLDHETPVYVDSNLGEGDPGEEISARISALGFNTVYLCTGKDRSEFDLSKLSHLAGIVGKRPPWL